MNKALLPTASVLHYFYADYVETDPRIVFFFVCVPIFLFFFFFFFVSRRKQ